MKKQQKAQVGEFPSKQKRMRGVNFKQSSLCPQLDGMSFGQKNWSQFIVLLLLTFLAFLSARLVGQFMGSISGLATLGLGYYSIGICVAVPLLVWTISVFF